MSKNLVILTLVVATVAACGGGTSTTSAPAVPAAPAAVASTAIKAASPDQVMLFTVAAPAGHTIVKDFGLYCSFGNYAGHGPYVEQVADALERVKKQVVEVGGNAVVNYAMTAGSYEQQGSKWQTIAFSVCGDMVMMSSPAA